MFDAGFLEMLVIGIIALLVLGPERLPVVAAKIGRFIGKARAFIANTRSDIERELKTEELSGLLKKQEQEIQELREIMQSKAASIKQELQQSGAGLDKELHDVAATIKSTPTPAPTLNRPPVTPKPTPTDQPQPATSPPTQDKNANL